MVLGASLVAGMVLLWTYRGLSFFYDEWDFIQNRRAWNPAAFLEPHNEHLVLLPAFIFKVLFSVFGIGSYWPYAVMLVITHIACALVLYALLRTWTSNEIAVAGTVVFLFVGTGWEVLLWPFEVVVTISLATGLGALLATRAETRRGDILACALLIASLASASLGISFVIGVAALIATRPGVVQRLYIVAVPAVLYGAWYLIYAESSAKASNIQQIPIFIADSAAAAWAGVFGMNPEIGRAIMVASAIAVVIVLVKNLADRRMIAALLVVAAITWALLCLSRFGIATPSTPRYVYPGVALMLALGAVMLGRRTMASPTARAVILVLLAASLMTNIGVLKDGGKMWRDYSAQVTAGLGAMTLVRDEVPAGFQPNAQYAPQVTAGPYFAAVAQLGSPAMTPEEIAAATPAARASADDVLRRAGAVTIANGNPSITGGARPRPAATVNGTATATGGAGCTTLNPTTPGEVSAQLRVPATGLEIRATGAPVGVRVSAFGDPAPGEPLAVASPGGQVVTVTPADVPAVPEWTVLASSAAAMVVCTMVG